MNTTDNNNLLNAGVDINMPVSTAINIALALTIPIVIGVVMLLYLKKYD